MIAKLLLHETNSISLSEDFDMALFGWLMFLLGAAMLRFMGVIGLDAGFGGNRVGNLPGILVGVALMISGSVFAAVGELMENRRLKFISSLILVR